MKGGKLHPCYQGGEYARLWKIEQRRRNKFDARLEALQESCQHAKTYKPDEWSIYEKVCCNCGKLWKREGY